MDSNLKDHYLDKIKKIKIFNKSIFKLLLVNLKINKKIKMIKRIYRINYNHRKFNNSKK